MLVVQESLLCIYNKEMELVKLVFHMTCVIKLFII